MKGIEDKQPPQTSQTTITDDTQLLIQQYLKTNNNIERIKMASYIKHYPTSNITPTSTSTSTYVVDARKNPIEYTKKDIKHSSKWKKYINKIHDLVMTDLPSMCMVQKTNNAYCYHSNDYNYTLTFECRIEGNPHERTCTAIIYNRGTKVFFKTRKTPKKLYNKLLKFISYNGDMEPSELNKYTKNKIPFVFTSKYIKMLKDKNKKVACFVSPSAYDFTSFEVEPLYKYKYRNAACALSVSDFEDYYGSDW